MFEALANMTALIKNAQALQGKAQEMKQRLADASVEAVSPDQSVRVIVTGELKIASLTLSPTAQAHSPEQLESLIAETVNGALQQAKKRASEEMASLADGMGIPGLQQLLSRLGVGSA
jgi:DNA-binding protein YbaB